MCTKFEISTLTHYIDIKGNENAKIGMVREVRGHPRSSETSPFDRAHMTSYSTLIETMPFSSYSAFFVESGNFNPPHLHMSPP